MPIEDSLVKIRPHTASQLSHQRAPAQLLVAMEDSFEERTPTAYFAATLSCLQSQMASQDEQGLDEGDRLPAIFYLFALILPHVPLPIIRSHLATILNILTTIYPSLNQHAPVLRSVLSITGSFLRALDRALLAETHGVKKLFFTLLDYVADGRPKVRKKAAEEVREVLETPPSPMQFHPYAGGVLKWTTGKLGSGGENGIHVVVFLRNILPFLHLGTQAPSEVEELPTQILSLTKMHNPHLEAAAYGLLSDLLSMSTSSNHATITTLLNNVPSAMDAQLSSAWSLIFTSLSLPRPDSSTSPSTTEFLNIFQTLFSFLSAQNASLQRTISDALSGFITLNFAEHVDLNTKEGKACVETVLNQLSQALVALPFAHAIPYSLNVLAATFASFPYPSPKANGKGKGMSNDETFQLVSPLITSISKLRVSAKFHHKEAADRVFIGVYFRWGAQKMLELVPLNIEPSERKEKGTEAHAYLLPLLASPASTPHPTPLNHFINYFVPLSERMFEYKVSAESATTPGAKEKGVAEVKMWNVLIGQVWACFAGYVDYRGRRVGEIVVEKGLLSDNWTPVFSQLLSTLLYNPPSDQKELRGHVLKGLRTVVESIFPGNPDEKEKEVMDASDDADCDAISQAAQEIRKKNKDFLASQAESWFGVLFNLFASAGVTKDERGPIGDVIRVWCTVSSPEILEKILEKMVSMLAQHLPRATTERQGHSKSGQLLPNNAASVVQRMEDLILIFLPFLSSTSQEKVWNFFLTASPGSGSGVQERKGVIQCEEVGVRKRAWRILGRCLETISEQAKGNKRTLEEVTVAAIVSVGETGGAKRDRLSFLLQLIPYVPRSSLHIIPSLIPEAVLGTKEPAERSRKIAFEVIVKMAEKMKEGGIVRRGLIDGGGEAGESMSEEVEASLEEYLVMIGAGLAGATPHMVSATVMALSRLVFEFHDEIKPETNTEILTTLIQFLTSTNREIIKSTLGFIKLAIHTLPTPALSPHLETLVTNLLIWAKDYKNHFKVRVQHIFERMMRVFGTQVVMDAVKDDEEGTKILEAVRKRKERAKRRKGAAKEREEKEETEHHVPARVHSSKKGEEFDDVLYGSESDDENSEDSEDEPKQGRSRKQAMGTKNRGMNHKQRGAKLRIDDDEPMDLLEGVGMRIEGNAKPRRMPGQEASRFKMDEGTGKMIIEDSDDADGKGDPISRGRVTAASRKGRGGIKMSGLASNGDTNTSMELDNDAGAGNAYIESMISTDGFTRGPNGRVKFNKDTKKRRRAEVEFEEGGMDIDGAPSNERQSNLNPPNKKLKEKKLGHEFKAKKAGGDVKKGSLDPYAYVPLGQAAKHQKGGKGKERIGIASKR